MLDGFLALNRGPDVVMLFEIDEVFEPVPLCETVNQTVAGVDSNAERDRS